MSLAQDNYSSVLKLAMPGKLELLNQCFPIVLAYVKESKKSIKGFQSETPEDLGERGLDNHAIWLWGMSPSLVKTWFTFLGFEVIFENKEPGADNYPWEGWLRWGCVAKRVR